MNIIYESAHQNTEALRLFTSDAVTRKNSLRIHHHVMIELSLILKGRGIYKAGDRTYSIEAGDIFLYRPNESHCITDIDEDGMTLLNLHIAPNYLYNTFQGAIGSDYIKILSINYNIGSNKLNDFLSASKTDEIRRLILKIKEEGENRQSDFLTVILNCVCNVMIEIARNFPEDPAQNNKKRSYRQVMSAIDYINAHCCEQITLANVAKSVGYSRCYCSDAFKNCLGMSVWEYICIKRIEKALTLIKTTDKNILDIATECGFNNTANFNKIFKKYTHMSPREFRK